MPSNWLRTKEEVEEAATLRAALHWTTFGAILFVALACIYFNLEPTLSGRSELGWPFRWVYHPGSKPEKWAQALNTIICCVLTWGAFLVWVGLRHTWVEFHEDA